MSTERGRAEVLLSPGVFLRLDADSAVRMLSNDLADVRVEILRGSALVEVSENMKGNGVAVILGGARTLLWKKGLYRLNADSPQGRVLDGKKSKDQLYL